jgi:hypothetical protein
VDDTHKCNGFYHYRSTGEAYGNLSEGLTFYLRTTNACDNLCYIFAPGGSASGFTCCDAICLESCGIAFDLIGSNDYRGFSPGNMLGYLEVETGQPVQVLSRDDSGYFVPPHLSESSSYSNFYTYQGDDDNLNIHSFADGTEVSILNLQTNPITSIWSGTLNEGETYTRTGSLPFSRVVRVRTTKGQASVSVLGGGAADDTNYMSYALDPTGNMQGSDFITQSHTGGFINVTGLEDGTSLELRDAASGELQSTHLVNQGQIVNVNPGIGIWRVRSTKDVTACVGKGVGGTFIPLTRNASGSTPFPPVIAGVHWSPFYPRTSNNTLTVTWLTDELATSKLNYRIGAGAWQEQSVGGTRTEHRIDLDISAISNQTDIRFRPESTDQSGSTTVDNNGGADYVVTVQLDAPDLVVELTGVVDQGTHYTLHFSVHNVGAGNANEIRLKCQMYGMQPFSEGVDSSYQFITSNRIDPTIRIDSIYPDGWAYPTLNVKPFLSETGPIDYRMTGFTSDAEDDWGHNYHLNHAAVTHDWNDAEAEGRYWPANYVVLANLARFYSIHNSSDPSSQAMPREMASFANQRSAALAYITSGDPYVIQDYVQGRFNGKVRDAWRDGGYLLLVGCSAIMPAFGWTLDCTFYDSFTLWMSDNTYANLDEDGHYTPELVVGRITGDHPDHFRSLFSRALAPQSYDKALCISGTGDGEGTFADNAQGARTRLDARYTDALYHRLSSYADTDRLGVYQTHDTNTDFLYYRDHGSVGGWDSLEWWDVASLSFGGKFPIVYSNACLTGQIQTNDNLAEEFLARCASVFIGATQVSPRSENNSLGDKITARHRDGWNIGQAFRLAKRSLAGDIHWYTTCYNDMQIKKELLMYNLYGDPVRGGSAKDLKEEKVTYDTPASPILVALPMVEITTGLDGLDHATIPDPNGDLLLAINEPIVPIYRWTAAFGPGIRVNNMTLASRSGDTHLPGLELPTAWGSEKSLPGPGDVPSPGDFPPDDFHWTEIERPDGGIDVVLTVHPFFYNAATKDATYYQNFTFNLDWTTSNVSILTITPTHQAIPIGSDQTIEVTLQNQGGAAETVNMTVDISNMGTGDSAALFTVNNIVIDPGAVVSRSVVWNPAGQPATGFLATVRVANSGTGDERDVGYSQFRVGHPEVTVTDFFFNQSMAYYVRDNENILLGLTAQNTGDVPVNATTHLEIRRASDNLLFREWACGLPMLGVGGSKVCSDDWSTTGLPEGDYDFRGWVEYEDGVTPIQTIIFGTLYRMRMGWWMPKDVFNRGDKIMATLTLYDDSGHDIGTVDTLNVLILRPNWTTFGPPVAEHPRSPRYSTSFIVSAAEPRGVYGLISTASRENGPTALGGRWFVVDDEGFSMTPDPPVCIADGISSITVTSDIVQEGGLTIPNGTLMTLTQWTGTIATPDEDPVMPGVQVASHGGQFDFVWQSPPQTSLDAFVYGTLGVDRPKSGVSARFKGVDFNQNKRVDVHDILFVQDSEGTVARTFRYDERKDLDEDGVVNSIDRNDVQDRWGIEFPGAVSSVTVTMPIGAHGVILRPIPDRASVPPGGDLSIQIVAEGVNDLGGYEFVGAVTGTALSTVTPLQVTTALESTGNFQTVLGPLAYLGGSRVGAFASGDNPGPGGATVLATLTLHADHLGDSRLILSSALLAQMDGTELPLMQVFDGLYRVEVLVDTPTPTETVAWTPTPTPTTTTTATPTTILTPSPTSTAVPGDTNGDGVIDANDLFHFCHEWKHPSSEADPNCNPVEDEMVDQKDLLELMKYWVGN